MSDDKEPRDAFDVVEGGQGRSPESVTHAAVVFAYCVAGAFVLWAAITCAGTVAS